MFEKFLASVVTASPLILGGLILAYLIVFRSDAGDSGNLPYLWAALAASFAGIVAYSAVFELVSLLVSRALLAGLTYSLVWESVLGRYLPGLRVVSIRHYTESIFVGMLDSTNYSSIVEVGSELDDPASVITAVLVIVAVAAIALFLSTW